MPLNKKGKKIMKSMKKQYGKKRGGKMRKKGAKGAPTAAQFRRAAMTVKKK